MKWLKQRITKKRLAWFTKRGFSAEAAEDLADTLRRRRVIKARKIGPWRRIPKKQQVWLKSVGKLAEVERKIDVWHRHCDRTFATFKYVCIAD